MNKIFIYFILVILSAIIFYFINKFISSSMQKERKIAEELIKMDNGKELINERIKSNGKKMIIRAICFYFGIGIISFIIMLLTLYIRKNI